MQIFLVGGAVRDELLNYPSIEKDWLVVGARAQDLLDRGYLAVGKDFPVFLHPESKEEYALARTERKTGPGYRGFATNADPSVTIEQDLLRRDLTINAIAKNASGELIDPYGGARDIENKWLRHISPAFAEDPVRILRVARFAARYAHLGFTVHPSTMALMQHMVDHDEVDHLVPERIWKELSRALGEQNPQVFIQVLRDCGALACIMLEIDNLFGVPQRAEHHPEVDCGIHTLLTLKRGSELSTQIAVRFSCLTHDLGKAQTPRDILPRHIGHEHRSEDLVKALCQRLKIPNEIQSLALLTAKYHTQCHRAFELKPSSILKLLEALDAFRKPQRVENFVLCCQADAQGRTGFESKPYPQAAYLQQAFASCQKISAKLFLAQGLQGKQLGTALRAARIEALRELRQHYNETSP